MPSKIIETQNDDCHMFSGTWRGKGPHCESRAGSMRRSKGWEGRGKDNKSEPQSTCDVSGGPVWQKGKGQPGVGGRNYRGGQ